jgi:hydroxymethylpyrimidine pyrophosphatase-like HAD family hydrolase
VSLNSSLNKPAAFKGNTAIYSDFDGTFATTYSHNALCGRDNFNPYSFNNVYRPITEFIESAKSALGNAVELIISTGRNMPKYRDVMRHLKHNGGEMLLPPKLITGNGGAVYKLTSDGPELTTKYGFNVDGAAPDSLRKKAQIKELTNWDASEVKTKFSDVLKNEFGINNIFDTQINEFNSTYSETILDELNKRGLNHQHSNFASIQNDGGLSYMVALNKDLSENPEQLGKIEKRVKEVLSNVDCNVRVTRYDPECGNSASIRILPQINGEPLDKVYDTKLAVKEILKTGRNDLVITAGDGINDLKMLNPFSYVDLIDKDFGELGKKIVKSEEEIYLLSSQKGLNNEASARLDNLKVERKNLLTQARTFLEKNPEVKAKMDKLPLMSVAIKRNGENSPVSDEICEFFGSSAKTLHSAPEELFDSIKKAMKIYADANPLYAKGLPERLKQGLSITKRFVHVA